MAPAGAELETPASLLRWWIFGFTTVQTLGSFYIFIVVRNYGIHQAVKIRELLPEHRSYKCILQLR